MANDPFFILIMLSCAAVLIILMIGVGGFAKGGDFNRKYANKVMRWRIGAQFVAVCLIVLFTWLRSKS